MRLRAVPTSLASEAGLRAAYAAHGDELYRAARRLCGDPAQAEEIVQETFVRAWRAADRFDEQLGTMRAWLFGIMRHLVIDQARAAAVRPPRAGAFSANVDEVAFDADEIDRAILGWQVEEAMRRLTRDHQVVLAEVHLRGRPIADVAAALGVPPGTVKSRVVLRLARAPGRARRARLGRRRGQRPHDGGPPVTGDDCRRFQGALAMRALGRDDELDAALQRSPGALRGLPCGAARACADAAAAVLLVEPAPAPRTPAPRRSSSDHGSSPSVNAEASRRRWRRVAAVAAALVVFLSGRAMLFAARDRSEHPDAGLDHRDAGGHRRCRHGDADRPRLGHRGRPARAGAVRRRGVLAVADGRGRATGGRRHADRHGQPDARGARVRPWRPMTHGASGSPTRATRSCSMR